MLLKWHARVGGEILATVPGGQKLQAAVHHHHESFDGGGIQIACEARRFLCGLGFWLSRMLM